MGGLSFPSYRLSLFYSTGIARGCLFSTKAQDRTGKILSGPFRAFPRVGQRVSLEETAKIKPLKKLQIIEEIHRNQAIPVIFGGDYWTRTSGLMRVKHAL